VQCSPKNAWETLRDPDPLPGGVGGGGVKVHVQRRGKKKEGARIARWWRFTGERETGWPIRSSSFGRRLTNVMDKAIIRGDPFGGNEHAVL